MSVAQSLGLFDDFRQITLQNFQGDMAARHSQVVVDQQTGQLPDRKAAMSGQLDGGIADLCDLSDRAGKVFFRLIAQRIHLQRNRYLRHL